MKKAILFLLVLAVLLLTVVGVFGPEKQVRSEQPSVIVSTFALYDIARHLLGGEAEVRMLIPFGRDVHAFEPTPKEMVAVEKSTLFLYSGAGLEPWAAQFKESGKRVDMSRYVQLQRRSGDHESEAHGHHDEEGAFDPHYWLDIANMIRLSKAMEALFAATIPGIDRQQLHARTEAYTKRLETLDTLFRKRLSGCALDTIVVGHNAFGYLAERYGFHVSAVSGLSPDTMPDAKTMAVLSDLVRAKGIKTVFYEAFSSEKIVASLAREAGVRVDVLQPLANITADEVGADYFLLMNRMLLKLHDALECR